MGGEREEIDGREGRGKNGKKVGEEREGERGEGKGRGEEGGRGVSTEKVLKATLPPPEKKIPELRSG